MSNHLVDKIITNSVFKLLLNEDSYVKDRDFPIDNDKSLFEENIEKNIFKERRIKSSERRINDKHDYRGPARRLTIDRRK